MSLTHKRYVIPQKAAVCCTTHFLTHLECLDFRQTFVLVGVRDVFSQLSKRGVDSLYPPPLPGISRKKTFKKGNIKHIFLGSEIGHKLNTIAFGQRISSPKRYKIFCTAKMSTRGYRM